MTTHIGELLDSLAERIPERPAIIAPSGEQRTFRELRDAAAGVSGRLDAWGVPNGGHVLLLVPVGIPLYELLLGIFWGGRVAVLVDPSLPRERLDPALSRVGLDAFVAIPKGHLLRLKVPALRGLGTYGSTGFCGPFARRITPGAPGPRRDPPTGEPALITFTTGTTGIPKAMGRSHRFLLAQHDVLADHMGLDDTDVDLPTLPVFLLNSLACGATCVLPDGDLRNVADIDPGRISGQVDAHGVTTTSGSPGFFAPWVAWLATEGRTLPSMKKVFVGGARVPADLVRQMAAAFPNATVHILYGSTEAEPMASLSHPDVLGETAARELAGEGSCVGAPVPQVVVRLVDPDTAGVLEAFGPERVGEVQVSGGHVNGGYYRDPSADHENKVRDGDRVWHRTGDAAWQDDRGRLWLVGRISSRVCGRYPFPIETQVEAREDVVRAALVEVDGQAVLAFSGSADPAELGGAFDVRAVRQLEIPLDPRHRAKVDRATLVARLRSGTP